MAIASSVGVTLDTIKPLLDGMVTVKRLADQGSDPRGAMPAVNARGLEQPTGRVLFPGGGMMEAEVLAVANTASRRVSRKRRADEGLGGSSTAVPEVASADAPSRILLQGQIWRTPSASRGSNATRGSTKKLLHRTFSFDLHKALIPFLPYYAGPSEPTGLRILALVGQRWRTSSRSPLCLRYRPPSWRRWWIWWSSSSSWMRATRRRRRSLWYIGPGGIPTAALPRRAPAHRPLI